MLECVVGHVELEKLCGGEWAQDFVDNEMFQYTHSLPNISQH